MNELQKAENGPPGGDVGSRSAIVEQPHQPSEAMALLKQEIRERRQVEEHLRQSNENLLQRLADLEQRDRDHLALDKLSNYLKSCISSDEACAVITAFCPQLIPSDAGTLYRINSPGGYLERVAGWGEITHEEKLFTVQDCWALRRGQLHWTGGARTGLLCQHATGSPDPIFPYLCIPLAAHGETVGLLFLQRLQTAARAQEAGVAPESKLHVATAVGEEISLALANLKLRDTLRQQSLRDPLTGLYNRRFLEEYLVHERVRATRKNRPLSVIMLDIDHFKRVNDTFGHDAGDAVLRRMGLVLQGHVRGSDIACRIGGEEFALLLPEASLVTAYQRAERMLDTVRHMQIKYRGQILGAITISMGVAAFPKHGDTPEALIRAADQALYQAKQTGRNKLASA